MNDGELYYYIVKREILLEHNRFSMYICIYIYMYMYTFCTVHKIGFGQNRTDGKPGVDPNASGDKFAGPNCLFCVSKI